MSREHTSHAYTASERRQARRFATNRPARFANARGEGPLMTGRVVEMSPCGMRIESAGALLPGQVLDVEIEPEHGEEVTLLRCEVIRAVPVADGKFSVGVSATFNVRGKPSFRPVTEKVFESSLASQSEAVDLPIAEIPAIRRRRKAPRRLLSAALLLFLVALLCAIGVPSDNSRIAAMGNGGVHQGAHSDTPLIDRARSSQTSPGSHVAAARDERYVGVATSAEVPQHRLEGRVESRQALVHSIALSSNINGPVPDAPRYALSQSERSAPSRSTGEFERDEWVEVEFGDALRIQPASGQSDAIRAEPALDEAPVLIEVDTANFVLHVRRHDAVVRSFPIGLGRNGTTPLGRFVVADKIVNPDWYDRGRSVPAGSPENPLGEHWMGLGNGTGPGTGIGMHPSADTRSLEQPLSRGCIRLTPADAASLFRLAPAGTPVWIHE